MYISRLPGTSFGVILVRILGLLSDQTCYANPVCTTLSIPLTATASNEVFPIPVGLNYSDPGAISALVQTVIGDAITTYPLIPTTYTGTIVARFCEPTVKIANRSDVVQYFVSGVTENKLYWSGLGYPNGYNGDQYSTIAYATSQGYPTFVIDRIGVGNTSPRPDPILQEQVNLEEAVNHKLVMMLKAGTAVPGKPLLCQVFLRYTTHPDCRSKIQSCNLRWTFLRLHSRQRPSDKPPLGHLRLHLNRLRRLHHSRRR